MKSYAVALLVLMLLPWIGNAQRNLEIGMLPAINFNKKLSSDWSLNFKLESRQAIVQDEVDYKYLLTDLSVAAAKKTGINTTVAIGYLARIEEEGLSNRIIQQINFLQRNVGAKLAHRLSTDQTFPPGGFSQFRLRYRLSTEIPLSGLSLDEKEFFLKFSNEYLNSWQGEIYDLEIRGVGFIGYVLSSSDKLEIGLDYRLDSFLNDRPRNRLWIALNFYQSI